MKGRDYKNFRQDCYYHIYNRGHNKENVFRDPQDYQQFLKRLRVSLGIPHEGSQLSIKPLPPGAFSIISYCLMANHFHIQIRQNSDTRVDRLITKVLTSYAMYFNRKYNRRGAVFEDRFKAKLITSEKYCIHLSVYIHKNPPEPFKHPYSSLREYLKMEENSISDPSIILKYFKNDWTKYKEFIKRAILISV